MSSFCLCLAYGRTRHRTSGVCVPVWDGRPGAFTNQRFSFVWPQRHDRRVSVYCRTRMLQLKYKYSHLRTVQQSSYWVALCWENQDLLYSTVLHLLWEWRFLMKFSPSVYSVPSVQWTGLLSVGNSNLVHSFSWGVVIYCCILFTMLVLW